MPVNLSLFLFFVLTHLFYIDINQKAILVNTFSVRTFLVSDIILLHNSTDFKKNRVQNFDKSVFLRGHFLNVYILSGHNIHKGDYYVYFSY